MSDGIKYYKFEKPLDASKTWESTLLCLCKKYRINCMVDKMSKGKYMYSLSCTKEAFDNLVKEMRKIESKTDEPDS